MLGYLGRTEPGFGEKVRRPAVTKALGQQTYQTPQIIDHLPIRPVQLGPQLVDERDPAGAGVGFAGGLPRYPEEGAVLVPQHNHCQVLRGVGLDWGVGTE